jgi:transcriptional regulator with XRE-family HTH domain
LLRIRGIPFTVLSAQVGVSVGYVSAILNGHCAPQRKFVVATAQFLGLPIDQLFTPELLQDVAP